MLDRSKIGFRIIRELGYSGSMHYRMMGVSYAIEPGCNVLSPVCCVIISEWDKTLLLEHHLWKYIHEIIWKSNQLWMTNIGEWQLESDCGRIFSWDEDGSGNSIQHLNLVPSSSDVMFNVTVVSSDTLVRVVISLYFVLSRLIGADCPSMILQCITGENLPLCWRTHWRFDVSPSCDASAEMLEWVHTGPDPANRRETVQKMKEQVVIKCTYMRFEISSEKGRSKNLHRAAHSVNYRNSMISLEFHFHYCCCPINSEKLYSTLKWRVYLVLMALRFVCRDWRSGGPRFKSHPRLTPQSGQIKVTS